MMDKPGTRSYIHCTPEAKKIAKLEAENQRLVNAIHQYMQTTAQCGPKSILVENFVGMYTYMEKGDE